MPSTTRSYRGNAFNRFRSIQTVCEDMAMPGELFSDEILSFLDQEDSEKELDILMLAVSKQYESLVRPQQQPTTVRVHLLRDPPPPQPQRFLHASLHRKRVKRYKKEDRIVY